MYVSKWSHSLWFGSFIRDNTGMRNENARLDQTVLTEFFNVIIMLQKHLCVGGVCASNPQEAAGNYYTLYDNFSRKHRPSYCFYLFPHLFQDGLLCLFLCEWGVPPRSRRQVMSGSISLAPVLSLLNPFISSSVPLSKTPPTLTHVAVQHFKQGYTLSSVLQSFGWQRWRDLFDKYKVIEVRRVTGDSTSVVKILDFGIDNP